MPILPDFTSRDVRQGVIRQSNLANFLAPDNSVSGAVNVDFDTIIGLGVVRPGTTQLGSAVAANRAPLGLNVFVTAGSITNVAIGVFKGASNASIYFYDTSWHTTGLTSLSNTATVNFAQLGNSLFMANGTDSMKSTPGGTTWVTTNCMTSRIPSLLFSAGGRLLAAGDPGYRCRIWFSSIIDPAATPFITWNENVSTGDFIDVNPDDGLGDLTGFAGSATLTLAFKANAFYRLNTIAKTIDPDLVFQIGAPTQKAITTCQGTTYFFSGRDIRSTTGDYPQWISRLGVQDFINAIPQANWNSVAAGNDGINVYFSIGNVTLNNAQNNQQLYPNVVLKFSPQDQSWTVRSYPTPYRFFTIFTQPNGRLMYGAEDKGTVKVFNVGLTDGIVGLEAGTPIFYELITQGLEFGDLAHTKIISDKIVIFSKYAQGAGIQIKADGGNYHDIVAGLNDNVTVLKNINFQGNQFFIRWYGNSTGQAPVWQGYTIPNISDQGITK